jgi:hypothetical protein
MARGMRRVALRLFGLGLLVAALWGLTRAVGAPAVEAHVLGQMQAPQSSKRVASHAALDGHTQTHYCSAVAVGPLIVRLEFGYTCGPLCGRGRTDYFLWLPGVLHQVHVGAGWVS